MARLIRQRKLVEDAWRRPGESGSGPELLGFAAARAAASLPAGSGVLVEASDAVEELAPHIARLALVVLHFSRNGDGRGYSQAQLLRGRLGYRGELRAAGDVKRDQLYLLGRCGCDSFELPAGEDPAAALAHIDDYSFAYQRSTGADPAPTLRSALRS